MYLRRVAVVAAASLAVAGTTGCTDLPTARSSEALATPQAAPLLGLADATRIPDRYIVVLQDEVADVAGVASEIGKRHGGSVTSTYRFTIKGFAARLSPGAVQQLRSDPRIKYIDADRVVSSTALVTQLSAPWGLDRIDQVSRPLNGTYSYEVDGRGVNVYVIDSGILTSHREFGGRARLGKDFVGGTGGDCTGHGTHVAGTIGGFTSGVAKGVNLIAVRVFACQATTSVEAILAGVDWVTRNRVPPAVANMSLGMTPNTSVDEAVKRSIARGVTYVVAAGNTGGDACRVSPARLAAVITVGSVASDDRPAIDSNRGACLDVWAPGVGIRSAWLGGEYKSISGTSMAAPHVAGAVALYLQRDPTASPAVAEVAIFANSTFGQIRDMTGSQNLLVRTPLRVPVHRLYHAGIGDHMYGLDPNEAAGIGYVRENRNYFFVKASAGTDHADLFRCYVPGTRDHFVSVSRNCEGMVVEARLGAIATRELPGTTALYRLYNRSNGDHFFTTSASERQSALNSGWVSEGVTGYVYRQW